MTKKVQRFYQSLDWRSLRRLGQGIFFENKFFFLNFERLRSRIFNGEEYVERDHVTHSMPHYHIALYTDNAGAWIDENGKHQARENEVLLIPPYYPHMIGACSPETYRMMIFTFGYYCDDGFLSIPFEELVECYSGRKMRKLPKSILLSQHKASQLEELMERLLDELLSCSSCREINVQECFLKLMIFVYESGRGISEAPDATAKERVAKIKSIIDRTPEDNLPLDKLTEKINMSKEHFIRTFKSYYGDSPGRYRQKRRLEKAVELLLTGNMKIKDIAECCGFENIYYFSKMFKQHFSVSPKEYRRQAERD